VSASEQRAKYLPPTTSQLMQASCCRTATALETSYTPSCCPHYRDFTCASENRLNTPEDLSRPSPGPVSQFGSFLNQKSWSPIH